MMIARCALIVFLLNVVTLSPPFLYLMGGSVGIIESFLGRAIVNPSAGDCRIKNTDYVVSHRNGSIVVGIAKRNGINGYHAWGIVHGEQVDLSCPRCTDRTPLAYIHVAGGRVDRVGIAVDGKPVRLNVAYVCSYVTAKYIASVIRKN